MQFAVPQFTDVEDKIIGPLTLKQFFVCLGASAICFMFWSLPLPKVISIIIDIPIALLGIAIAFAQYNGRPMLSYIFPFISYAISPKAMIFARESISSSTQAATPVVKVEVKKEPEEAPDSRLRKLAYLLDKKSAEETELLNSSNTKNTNSHTNATNKTNNS